MQLLVLNVFRRRRRLYGSSDMPCNQSQAIASWRAPRMMAGSVLSRVTHPLMIEIESHVKVVSSILSRDAGAIAGLHNRCATSAGRHSPAACRFGRMPA